MTLSQLTAAQIPLGLSSPTTIEAVATATPPRSYGQMELLDLFGLRNRVALRVFSSPHIGRRYLTLPEPSPETGVLPLESKRELIDKFAAGASSFGLRAIKDSMLSAGCEFDDIGALVCVTSTGFMVPGLSGLFARELGLPSSVWRLDIVGMGCNAGLNGLQALDSWTKSNPGRRGILVCCEVNSAIYCRDDTASDGIVNSLFGDGAAAIVACSQPNSNGARRGPRLLDFESHMIGEEFESMRFDWHDEQSCWRFVLSRDIPYVLGVHCSTPVEALLARNGVKRGDIRHWIMHTGGGAVIDAIKLKLGLTEYDVRHTRTVLHDFGNLSSGSFLFSYQRLEEEAVAEQDDYGLMMTMGPGAQIETALLQW